MKTDRIMLIDPAGDDAGFLVKKQNMRPLKKMGAYRSGVIRCLLMITLACGSVLPSCGGGKTVEQAVLPPSAQYVIGPEDLLKIDVWNVWKN